MKGHVGGGSGFWRIQGVGYPVKAKSLFMSFMYPYVKLCAERLLEIGFSDGLFRSLERLHKLESLIMAQNERWRHA
jgi:hypothetical protein